MRGYIVDDVNVRDLFEGFTNGPCGLRACADRRSFRSTVSQVSFTTIVFSFSTVEDRHERKLSYLARLTVGFPHAQHLIVTSSSVRTQLVNSLSPSPLSNMLDGTSALRVFRRRLFLSLGNMHRTASQLGGR